MHGALNYRVMAIFCPDYKKLLKNMKLQCLELFIMTKKKFLEDFREISLVGSLNLCYVHAGDWIVLAQEMEQWRAYVMAVMNLRVSQKPISKFNPMRLVSVCKY